MPETMICAVVWIEYDSKEEADRSAEKFKECPHIGFWATWGNRSHIVLILPERKRWWAAYIVEHPGTTFGGKNADLVFPDRVHRPSMLEMRIPGDLGERAPCGAHCPSCPSYIRCVGCPATIHYKSEG